MNKQYRDQQQVDAARLKHTRTLAGADVLTPRRTAKGYQHRALQDSGYIALEGEAFVRRAVGKVKGKAAVKAAKKARIAARNRLNGNT